MSNQLYDDTLFDENYDDFVVVPTTTEPVYGVNSSLEDYYSYGKFFFLPEKYVFDDYWYSGIEYNTDLYYRQMVVDRFKMDFCNTRDTVPQFVQKYNNIVLWLMRFNPLVISETEAITDESNPFRTLQNDQTFETKFGFCSYKKDTLVQYYLDDQYVDFGMSDTDPIELYRQDPFGTPTDEMHTIFGSSTPDQLVAICPIFDPRFTETTNVEVREIA